MDDSDTGDIGWALFGIGLVPLFLLFFFWVVSACVAAAIASDRGRSFGGWFAVTFFFLGPLGPGFALLAQRELNGVPVGPSRPPQVEKKREVAAGRRRFVCPRCGAENDIPDADTSYDCWRCAEHRAVKPKKR